MQALFEDMFRLFDRNVPICVIKMYVLTFLKTSNLIRIIFTKVCALQIHGELYVRLHAFSSGVYFARHELHFASYELTLPLTFASDNVKK